ncbi:DNA-3-methyladenine glycosylase family protein [Sutcliffiella rhizosphaerae]|uniref:DNA-3-methyladenine glycosylase II n=1 Tax=Sutcliffiella rhizosphaerae TaxID=2880967 RepID=A0ABM8YMR5_9BACI|nr:DNA-3-methyladenine glycosylase [Sutcliffiella rhizosphaerae]CAG9621284.1 DNA-3-methyladenine glycosylase [Sutcliffiella rhizosphaerae]
MNWMDRESYVEIFPPKEFSFEECLIFLGRSDKEVLHRISEGTIYKLIQGSDAIILCKIGFWNGVIKVEFPLNPPAYHERIMAAEFIWYWFDLDFDLSGFYHLAEQDSVLKTVVPKYMGLRMIGIPDLFEAIVWAIMGQQINLSFAYTLKKRFVEQFGEGVTSAGETYWLFPTSERIASLKVEELKSLQFTTRKAEYILNIAKLMANGELSKKMLLQKETNEQRRNVLLKIRGIGAWTADYVLMKCLHNPTSLPIADAGLHQALKKILMLEKKPTLEQIGQVAENWEGYQAYATFYLWRSLYDETS